MPNALMLFSISAISNHLHSGVLLALVKGNSPDSDTIIPVILNFLRYCILPPL